ncbi:hypothetical protein DdX_00842 [Ditylenchus destructor]|uniref:Uncharacterized protein n=1 Tax=Ditylenchus destructor TaxID=166010 RepID=A0AAD4RDJ8_9BILA|nr:hypothetical protein DdX_00842 [Ditylenchus destructor]
MIDIAEIAVLSTIFLYSWSLTFSCTRRRHKGDAKVVNDTGKVNEKILNKHANDKLPASSENMVDVKSLEVVATLEQKSYEDKPSGKP